MKKLKRNLEMILKNSQSLTFLGQPNNHHNIISFNHLVLQDLLELKIKCFLIQDKGI